MVFEALTDGFEISTKKLAAITILFSTSLAWFYLFHVFLLEEIFLSSSNDLILVYIGKGLFYISIAFSAIIGSLISEKIERRKLLLFWIFFGVLTTAFFAFFRGAIVSIVLSTLLGTSFGLGFPSCSAFLADYTSIEERARVSGIVIIFTFVILSIVLQGSLLLELRLIEFIFLGVILRSISFFTLLLDSCERVKGKKKSWLIILTTRGFMLYLFPWLMFNIANGVLSFAELGLRQSLEYKDVFRIGSVIQYISTTFSAVISGIIADRFGRRSTIILGLVTLGASYAFLSLVTSPFSYLLTKITSGIAWGFIMTTHALTVLGDLAAPGSKERFYALGGIVPLIVSMTFQLLSGAVKVYVPISIVSSILSIVLLLSVLPLLYAPETLPETKVQARKMREYIKKVKNFVKKKS